MVRIKRMKHLNIYSDSDGNYIVHNTRKNFDDGHTHIKNYKSAEYVAYMALYKRMPKNNHLSIYLIDSVIRISEDKKYIAQMQSLKEKEIEKKNRREN